MDFSNLQVPELRQFLQRRGISCSLYNILNLIRLCEIANELKLETIDQEDDYKVMDIKRRTLDDGSILPELSTIQNWNSDLKFLPEVLTCDILVYFMSYCAWDARRLREFKMENGYRLYKANHVDKVLVSPVPGFPFIYVKSLCTPETRQNATPYTTWVILKADGQVHCSGCSCVADNGTCKHCVALLFALVDFSDRHHDRHTQVGTDVICTWDRPRISSQPMEIDDIVLCTDNERSYIAPTQANYDPRNCSTDQTAHATHNVEKSIHKLCKGTEAVFLHILDDSSDDSSEEEILHPLSVEEIVRKCDDKDDVISVLQTHHDISSVDAIEKLTRGQSENADWFKYRKGRITASLLSSVLHFRFTNKPTNYILDKMLMKKSAKSASLDHGKMYEPIARKAYAEQYKKAHKVSKITECGLFVDKKYPFIGASPDGLVQCKCCGKGLLEIKCSYQFRDVHSRDACQDKDYHVYLADDGNVKLKESSPWYVQIHGQMGVAGLEWCDFVLYTRKGHITERIYFDNDLYKTIVNKCEKFFKTYVINEL